MRTKEEYALNGFLTESKVEIALAAKNVAREGRKRASTSEVLTDLGENNIDERIIFTLPVQNEGVPLVGYNASVTGTHVLLERSGDIWSERVVVKAQSLSHLDSNDPGSEMNASVSISSKGVATLQIDEPLKGANDTGDIAFTTAADRTSNTSLAMRTAVRRGLLVAGFALDAFNQVHGIDHPSAGRIRVLQAEGNHDYNLGEIPITPLLLRKRPQ